jgi:hypothetical protein
MDQDYNAPFSACWAGLPSLFILLPVTINIFGYVIIPKDLIWCALCYAMKTLATISALCAITCDYDDFKSVMMSTYVDAMWEQILCSSTDVTSYKFPNDKQK